jgi:LacI family transcriptional regulator
MPHLGASLLLGREQPPTAIFAGAGVVALGVLDALTEAGVRVAADISVAGYDTITLAGFRPIALTTAHHGRAGHDRRTPMISTLC